jgi:phosphonate transport system permease protein
VTPTTLPPRPSPWTAKTVWGGAAAIAIAIAAYQAGLGRPGVSLINWGGWPQLRQFLLASLSPDLSADFLAVIGQATLVTLAYAVVGTVLSIGLGLLGGILCADIWWQTVFPPGRALGWVGRAIWLMSRGILAIPRAIHELIWGLVLLQVLGLNPLVAILAIAIPFGAIVSKVFSEILDETPRKPLQALLNAGVPPLAALTYGLLPQALPNLLSYTFYRFECSLRSAAVLGVIGAGGLGYEIFLSLQSLRYEQLWTGFYALIALNGAVDAWSALVRRRMGFTSRLAINQKSNQNDRPQDQDIPLPVGAAPAPGLTIRPRQDWFLRLSWIGVLLALPLAWSYLQVDIRIFWSSRTRRLLEELGGLAQPTWPSMATLVELGRLSYLTLMMSILAIAIASSLALIVSLPAAQNFLLPGGLLRPIGQRQVRIPWVAYGLLVSSRLLLLISRAIPAPIWALVLLFMLFPGVWPGALALAAHNFGILGRLMAEANENLDDRPVRGLRALGSPPAQLVLYGILPQNLQGFLAYSLYRWEVCLRETVIVGLVGAGGLGRLLTEQISSFDYSGVAVTLGVFVVLTFGVDGVSHHMRQALRT